MFELPARMTQLQANILAGDVSAQEALLAQVKRGQSLNATFACVVEELPFAPPQNGPFAGFAFAQMAIFELIARLTGSAAG